MIVLVLYQVDLTKPPRTKLPEDETDYCVTLADTLYFALLTSNREYISLKGLGVMLVMMCSSLLLISKVMATLS